MFNGQVATPQRLNLYDEAHYNVFTNLTAAMAQNYVCPACNKVCERGVSTGKTRHAVPARPFSHASKAIPGSPATSVIDTLGKQRTLRNTKLSINLVKQCARPGGRAASVVQ